MIPGYITTTTVSDYQGTATNATNAFYAAYSTYVTRTNINTWAILEEIILSEDDRQFVPFVDTIIKLISLCRVSAYLIRAPPVYINNTGQNANWIAICFTNI